MDDQHERAQSHATASTATRRSYRRKDLDEEEEKEKRALIEDDE